MSTPSMAAESSVASEETTARGEKDLPVLLSDHAPLADPPQEPPPIAPLVFPGDAPSMAAATEEFDSTQFGTETLGVDAAYPPGEITGSETTVFVPAQFASSAAGGEEYEWIVLPQGLLWHSYLAGPQEPRISAILFGDDDGGFFWDATLGGRVGLLRYGTPGAADPHGWQWDLEGAAITRLDMWESQDVESVDYRFGTELTWAEGPWAMKAGYFHISSHVGDEYLIRNPTFERINYVTESLIWGVSYKPTQPVRLYGEAAYAVHCAGGAQPWQFQTGAEWTPAPSPSRWIAPFAAANLGFFEATEYHMQTTLQAGWALQGSRSAQRLRFGFQYGQGPTNQFSFFQRSDEYLGWGIWFDY
ncbi:DUF1207 domain-containing protein [Allorhodopirellula solitaria]|nr:DUF1207 domain-containing protein [Allorhodopirellula solitaria]